MENNNDARILKRLRITALSLAIALVLLCMGGVIGLKKLNRLHKDLVETVEQPDATATPAPSPTPDPFAAALSTDVDYYETGEIKKVPIYSQKQRDRFLYSFLIVIQNGSVEEEAPQTDMMFIASFNALKQQFTVVSLMRDMLVPIEGYGWKRLNAAYSLGGMGLLMNTLNSVFDLDLQNYVYTGTEDLAQLADIIGGIPATLTEEEAAYINGKCGGSLTAGQQQLNGKEAVIYLLDRTSGGTGDFGRTQRQLKMVEDALTYLRLNQDVDQMTDLFLKIITRVRTNLDGEILEGIANEAIRTDELGFQGARVPFDDSYTETSQDGAFAVIPEVEKNKILLNQLLYSKE